MYWRAGDRAVASVVESAEADDGVVLIFASRSSRCARGLHGWNGPDARYTGTFFNISTPT